MWEHLLFRNTYLDFNFSFRTHCKKTCWWVNNWNRGTHEHAQIYANSHHVFNQWKETPVLLRTVLFVYALLHSHSSSLEILFLSFCKHFHRGLLELMTRLTSGLLWVFCSAVPRWETIGLGVVEESQTDKTQWINMGVLSSQWCKGLNSQ